MGKIHQAFVIAAILGVIMLFSFTALAQTTTFTVRTTSDVVVANACENNTAACSLRGAIQAANPVRGAAIIQFNIPPTDPSCAAGVCTINISSILPDLTGSNTFINGPGADRLIVKPSDGVQSPVFVVSNTSGTVGISGLTISDGFPALPFAGGVHKTGAGTLELIEVAIKNNRSTSSAPGGIYSNGGTLSIIRSLIFSNSTPQGFGGGVRIGTTSTCNIVNSTILANNATEGGGIFNLGTLNISNSTVSSNAALQGGGISQAGGVATIKSTIVARNIDDQVSQDVRGNFTSAGFNLIGQRDGSTGFTAATDLTGTAASPLNSGLTVGMNNGGPTLTISLNPNSPAIDKGSSSGLTGVLTRDQRSQNYPRRRDNPLKANAVGGDGTDIGAYEAHISPVFDFDGDGRTDVSIFRPSAAEWWIYKSLFGDVFAAQFGATSDKIVPADYTGDGKTDIAFWRPATGQWFIIRSENETFFGGPFGAPGDIPVPADYDGDRKADVAVFRPSTGFWFIQRSSNSQTTAQLFGTNGDQPIANDYDGDGRADVAIYRPSVSEWWLNRTTAGTIAYSFGANTDKIVPGDYTGDGKTDVAFWRPITGQWFVLRSENSTYFSAPFGASTDIPTPGDFDGDGMFDVTVFRPSNGTWFIQRTSAGTLAQTFGANADRPLPTAFLP